MAKSKKKASADDGEEEVKGKGKVKLIGGVLVLVLAGGGYYFTQMKGSSAEAAPAPEPGTIVACDSVVANLSGGGYLKVTLALQLTKDASGGEDVPTCEKAQDLAIDEFSEAKPADVVGQREKLKADLQKKIEKTYDKAVMGIYYTDYVTQ